MKLHKVGVVLLALLLAAMAMVPMVNAADNYEEKMHNWQTAHTISVTKTVSDSYIEGILTTRTVYTGKELTKRLGLMNL